MCVLPATTPKDKIPIISGLIELVGIGVTGWFIWRYMLFGPDRCGRPSRLLTWQSPGCTVKHGLFSQPSCCSMWGMHGRLVNHCSAHERTRTHSRSCCDAVYPIMPHRCCREELVSNIKSFIKKVYGA